MVKNLSLALSCSILLIGCAAKVATKATKSYPALSSDSEVVIYGLTTEVISSAEELGIVKIGDSGFSTNCGYDVVIDKAKQEARKVGGNALKIIEHKGPKAFGSSCDRIVAKIYRIENLESTKAQNEVNANDATLQGDYSRFRLSLGGGFSYRTAKVHDGGNISSAERDYIRELKSGYGFTADATYLISESIGLGAWYAIHRSKNSHSSLKVSLPNGGSYTGPVSDDISIQFIGPNLANVFMQGNKKGMSMINFSLGYLGYKNLSTLGSSFVRVEGATLGLATGIGYDFVLSKNFGIGLGVSVIAGSLSTIKVTSGATTTTIELDKGNYENLTRVDITAGIRLYQ